MDGALDSEITQLLTAVLEELRALRGDLRELVERLAQPTPPRAKGQPARAAKPARAVPVAPPAPVAVSRDLSTVLKKEGLRPLPEHRPLVLRALVALSAKLTEPQPMNVLKIVLAGGMACSSSQLQDMLNAVLLGGCALAADGTTVTSFTTPWQRLVSTDPADLDHRCLECYARTVLAGDADYFDDPEHIAEFERVTGGAAPAADAIERLRPPAA